MSELLKRGNAAQIFAASCTGLDELSRDLGRPIVLIDASLEPELAIEELRAAEHGGARRWADSFQPLLPEPGWTDWRLVKLEPHADGPATPPFGIEVAFGVVHVPLSNSMPLPAFRAQLHGALRHLQLQAVTIQPSFLEERSDGLLETVVNPRYTLARAEDFRGAELVENLFVLDPVESYWRLFWAVVAARAAAGEGAEARWK